MPILVGLGLPIAAVAPAALAATFLTSVVDATTYALPALTTTGPITPGPAPRPGLRTGRPARWLPRRPPRPPAGSPTPGPDCG
ncbi:hypothetical protein ACQEV4_24900 [Streptomyces shenzhenensis]|uniref:hypothetical protein n=1 Tax=Streptomyces shenzhenensis TaxID=943815 RepID=UPI003D9411AF